MLTRRDLGVAGALTALASLIAACGGGARQETSRNSQAPTANAVPTTTAAATDSASIKEWRSPSEIGLMPDMPSRGIMPTTPNGKPLSAYGLKLTVPQSASYTERPNENGLPMTFIHLDGDGHDFPVMVLSFVAEARRSLAEETFFQETLLLAARNTNTFVARTPEYWPVGEQTTDACLITWTSQQQNSDGKTETADNAALYITDGNGGYWRVLVAAKQGGLQESGTTWQTFLSAKVNPT